VAILAVICALGVIEIYSATHGSALAGMHMKTDPLAGGGSGADVRVVPRGLSRDHGPGAHFVHYRNCGVIGGFIGGSHAVWGQNGGFP